MKEQAQINQNRWVKFISFHKYCMCGCYDQPQCLNFPTKIAQLRRANQKKNWMVQMVVISTHRIFMEWDEYACNFQSMKVKKNPKNIHLGSKIDQFKQFWDIFEEEIFFSFLRWPEGPCTIFANYFSNAIFCLAFTNCYSFLSYLERKKMKKKVETTKEK